MTDKRLTSWKEAGLSNSFMFRLVMEKPELCRMLIETVLDIKIRKLEYLEPEKSFEAKLASKGIRLDIYAEDDAGTAYDIEMQVAGSDKRNLGRRTRYYQSLMDDDALKKGMLYSRLRKSVIIFICTFDPFDRGLGRYTFSSLCREDNSLELGDEVTKVFINTTGDKHQLTRELVSLMEYINEGKVTDSFTEKLNDRVAALRDDDGKEALFMTYQQTLSEVEDKGLQDSILNGFLRGFKKGIQRGIQKGIQKGIQRGIQKGIQKGIRKGIQRGIQKGIRKGT